MLRLDRDLVNSGWWVVVSDGNMSLQASITNNFGMDTLFILFMMWLSRQLYFFETTNLEMAGFLPCTNISNRICLPVYGFP